ncbi:MAG: hypothetical protein WBD81_17995 [Collimonas pratensis]|uniref:hypothetical protein n=1 Tax=Collimonas pratensis TaxID=279113 RepID=UPI003C76F36E
MNTPTLDMPMLPDSELQIPESRIRDGWHAHAIFRRLDFYDSASEIQRANIDYMIDGGKPYSERALAEAGRGEDANVNFMEAKSEDDMAQTPFIEMTTVSKRLWNVTSNFGDEREQQKNSNIISEEFTRTVREWDEDFDYFRLRLAQQFTRHGPAYVYWEDEFDWRWRADGPTAFKVPRNTESRASAIPYCVCKRTMSVDELYAYIRDEKHAAEVGRWNIEATKRALYFAAFDTGRPWADYSWEEFVAEAKENDIEFGSRGQQVRVFHLWVREFDGRISHYIGMQSGVMMENGRNADDITKSACDFTINDDGVPSAMTKNKKPAGICGNGFLYAHRFRFPAFKSCIIPFFYSIGTHGTIHTIRAQGEMNFAPIAISNRTRNKMIDCTGASMSIVVECEDANEAEGAAYRQMGPFMIKGGRGKITATAMPDVADRGQPVLDEMARLRQQISPNSTAGNAVDKSKQPQSKYQIQSNQNKDSALGSAMLTQFFGPWGRLGKEMFRRMMRKDLSEREPGGKEAMEFRARCMLRGVPLEAMQPDRCTIDAVRTIGNGSPQVRQYASERVLELSEDFDEVGRYNAKLDALAAIPGMNYDAALSYAGPPKGRTTEDASIANLENGLFQLGKKQPVEDDQDDWVHCQHHEKLVSEYVDNFNEGTIDGPTLVPVLDAALANMLLHSEKLSKNKTRQKEAAEVRAFLQQNGGILQQQQEKMIAQMHRDQDQQAQGQNGQTQDGEAQRKAESHAMDMEARKQKLAMDRAEFEQKLDQQDRNAAQIRTLRDLDAARKTALEAAA